jgi:hypothetical protein
MAQGSLEGAEAAQNARRVHEFLKTHRV